MREYSDRLKSRLEAVLGDDPINYEDHVDYTIVNPQNTANLLGPVLRYFGRVEGETPRNGHEIQAFIPNPEPHIQQFVPAWIDQEVPHGKIFDRYQREVGLEPAPLDLTSLKRKIRIAGYLGRTAYIQDVFSLIYLTRGAMHERTTLLGYGLFKQQALAYGERALALTAIKPIMVQEGRHFAYYEEAAYDLAQRLTPTQKKIVRIVTERGYDLVGAGTSEQKADFGEMAEVLLDGVPTQQKIDDFTKPTISIARKILSAQEDGLDLPNVVAEKIHESIHLLEERRKAQMEGRANLVDEVDEMISRIEASEAEESEAA